MIKHCRKCYLHVSSLNCIQNIPTIMMKKGSYCTSSLHHHYKTEQPCLVCHCFYTTFCLFLIKYFKILSYSGLHDYLKLCLQAALDFGMSCMSHDITMACRCIIISSSWTIINNQLWLDDYLYNSQWLAGHLWGINLWMYSITLAFESLESSSRQCCSSINFTPSSHAQ